MCGRLPAAAAATAVAFATTTALATLAPAATTTAPTTPTAAEAAATTTAASPAAAATTATATTAAAEAAATSAATTAAEAATLFTGTGFVDGEIAAAEGLAVHAFDCALTFGRIGELNEPEATGPAGLAVHDQGGRGHCAELLKHLPQFVFRGLERQIANIQLHSKTLDRLARARHETGAGNSGGDQASAGRIPPKNGVQHRGHETISNIPNVRKIVKAR